MQRQAGFTLIELMVVVAVLGIIAAIALPSYNEHVRAGRRAAAVSAVGDLQLQQERWRAENTTYAAQGSLTMPEASQYYNYAVTGGANYTVTATPAGKQAGDTCGTLTATNNSKPTWATASCNNN